MLERDWLVSYLVDLLLNDDIRFKIRLEEFILTVYNTSKFNNLNYKMSLNVCVECGTRVRRLIRKL